MAITARSYTEVDVVGFRFTKAKFGVLSNMHPGYPLKIPTSAGVVGVDSSETLYQLLKFPEHPGSQQQVIDAGTPMAGKKVATSIRTGLRTDWDGPGRISAMRWALRLKLVQHREDVVSALNEAGDRPIVEVTLRDDFWGAKPKGDGSLHGCNVLGRLWMELQQELRANPDAYLDTVAAPGGGHRILGADAAAWTVREPAQDMQGRLEL